MSRPDASKYADSAKEKSARHFLWLILLPTMFFLFPLAAGMCGPPDPLRGIYLPGHCLSERRIQKAIHYASQADLNAVVLHVKDPRGQINWASENPVALAIGAPFCQTEMKQAVSLLKNNGIWAVAKVDVFIDSLLVKKRPHLGVPDRYTGGPWRNKHGLHWTNPFDRRVWEYNISLCKELAALGFDEIQFDYVRFPSDGNLSRIRYPKIIPGSSKARCIGDFLKAAYRELSPLNVTISADLFGLTAWKKDDLGVGQVLEEMAPHVDVICPMLYPSHFPKGFRGWKNPGLHPRQIMALSMKKIAARTSRKVRPWVQGFWYTPHQITAQIQGIADAGSDDWTVWNPSGDYAALYAALSRQKGKTFSKPKFYPGLAELRSLKPRIVGGHSRVINFTDYRNGYTVLSLEEPERGGKGRYASPVAVAGTLDEAVMDRILVGRSLPAGPLTPRAVKIGRIAHLIARDIGLSPRRIRPVPIHIAWTGNCRFTRSVPPEPLAAYQKASAAAPR